VYVDVGASGVMLDATGDPANPRLFAYIGDADDDNEFGFTKQG
jgi:hypothetical protein